MPLRTRLQAHVQVWAGLLSTGGRSLISGCPAPRAAAQYSSSSTACAPAEALAAAGARPAGKSAAAGRDAYELALCLGVNTKPGGAGPSSISLMATLRGAQAGRGWCT